MVGRYGNDIVGFTLHAIIGGYQQHWSYSLYRSISSPILLLYMNGIVRSILRLYDVFDRTTI